MKRFFFRIAQYSALITLVVVVVAAKPMVGLTQGLIDGLTAEATYVTLVRHVGIGKPVRKLADRATQYLAEVRQLVVSTARDRIPGGRFFEHRINDTVDKNVPASISLEKPLGTLIAGTRARQIRLRS